jgi:hypothetical protein
MWCARHTLAAVGLLGLGPIVGGAASALAQAGVDAVAVSRPDESHARQAHRLVEGWVRRGGVPGERAEPIRALDVIGVRVTLRLSGVTLGEGTAVRPGLATALVGDAAEPLPPIDLVSLLEPATSRALTAAVAAAEDRHLQARLRAARDPEARDVGEAITPRALGAQLDVDLQLAHRPQRIVIARPDRQDTVFARFAPGHHGLMTRPPDAPAADTLVWPATALARNLQPDRQIVRLLHRSGAEPDAIDRLGRPDGLPLYRFDVLHLVRPRADQPVMLLTRGSERLPVRFVTRATLQGMMDRVGLHLFGRFIGDGRVRGGYRPARGRYQPELADDRESALAAYALIRFERRKRADGNNDRVFETYVDQAAETVRQVASRALAEGATPQPVTSAFCLLAVTAAPAGTFEQDLRGRLTAQLLAWVDDAGRVRPETTDDEAGLPPAVSSIVLWALTHVYDQTRDAAVGQAVARLLDGLWADANGNFDINALPWVAAAHERIAPVLEQQGAIDAETRRRRAADLNRMAGLIAQLQVVERPRLGPDDVVGGIVVQRQPDDAPPSPDWKTAPLFLFLATAVRDEQIVPAADRPDVLVTLSGAARFLGQLMIDEPATFAVASPEEALGGVRLAPWDNRLDLAPSALTLLGLVEMIQSDQALRGSGKDADPG